MKNIHVRDILRFLDQWAPPGVKMDYDNVGLQTGHPDQEVRGILVCLDVTDDVVSDALDKECNVIVSHHPLIFQKIGAVTRKTAQGRILYRLIREDISLVTAHTNLDAALDGVSFALANDLGLDDLRFLSLEHRIRTKIRLTTSHPDSGEILKLLNYHSGEEAHYWAIDGAEQGLKAYEAILDRHQVDPLLGALRKGDLLVDGSLQEVRLENPSANFGMGVIGSYPEPGIGMREFLHLLCSTLGVDAVRYAGHPEVIRNVAVCGGSGAFLIPKAIQAGVDAFVTADLKYHDYFLDSPRMMLADIGHFESEYPVVDVIRQELSQAFEGLGVHATRAATNPVRTYIPDAGASSPRSPGGT